MRITRAKWLQVPYEDYTLHVVGAVMGSKNRITLTKVIEVKGGRVVIPGLDNLNFFIHDSVFTFSGWTISHLETGTLVHSGAYGDDKEKVIADATAILISKFKDGALQAAITKKTEAIHKSKNVEYPINEIVD